MKESVFSPEDLWIYQISYMYYGVVAVASCVFVAVPISLATGWNRFSFPWICATFYKDSANKSRVRNCILQVVNTCTDGNRIFVTILYSFRQKQGEEQKSLLSSRDELSLLLSQILHQALSVRPDRQRWGRSPSECWSASSGKKVVARPYLFVLSTVCLTVKGKRMHLKLFSGVLFAGNMQSLFFPIVTVERRIPEGLSEHPLVESEQCKCFRKDRQIPLWWHWYSWKLWDWVQCSPVKFQFYSGSKHHEKLRLRTTGTCNVSPASSVTYVQRLTTWKESQIHGFLQGNAHTGLFPISQATIRLHTHVFVSAALFFFLIIIIFFCE